MDQSFGKLLGLMGQGLELMDLLTELWCGLLRQVWGVKGCTRKVHKCSSFLDLSWKKGNVGWEGRGIYQNCLPCGFCLALNLGRLTV